MSVLPGASQMRIGAFYLLKTWCSDLRFCVISSLVTALDHGPEQPACGAISNVSRIGHTLGIHWASSSQASLCLWLGWGQMSSAWDFALHSWVVHLATLVLSCHGHSTISACVKISETCCSGNSCMHRLTNNMLSGVWHRKLLYMLPEFSTRVLNFIYNFWKMASGWATPRFCFGEKGTKLPT